MKQILALLLAATMVCGCATVSMTQIQAFGDSAQALIGNVDKVLEQYNETALERSFTNYAATYNGKHAKLLTRAELEKIRIPIDGKRKKDLAIYSANSAIAAYAKSLSALARADSGTEIDLASTKLYGAFVGLNDHYKIIKGTDRDLFSKKDLAMSAKFIAAIGRSIVEKKRRSAIKEIIINADPKIEVICDEINHQLGTAGIGDAIYTSRQYILTEEIKEYKSRAKQNTQLDWRRSQIKKLYELQQEMKTSKLLVQKTANAVSAIKKSHHTLAEELEKDRFNSAAIAQVIGRLQKLNKHYGEYETLLQECNEIVKDENGLLSCKQ